MLSEGIQAGSAGIPDGHLLCPSKVGPYNDPLESLQIQGLPFLNYNSISNVSDIIHPEGGAR